MPLTPDLSPSIRLQQPPGSDTDNADLAADGITIEFGEDPIGDQEITNDKGEVIQIEHGDGSVTVSVGGGFGGLGHNSQNLKWFGNLAEHIDSNELSSIAEKLLRGIQNDIESRRDWIDARAEGIKLLGLKIEIPGTSGSSDGAPVESQSRVRHPLLLEAVLRFQANAYAEMLPADGPVKIRNDDNNATLKEDTLANALEKDMNHYLTKTASEYYPDTDRMLVMLGFGGLSFKKVYYCPLRNRPVSDSIDANDLIVNNAATDIGNARRVTHRTFLKPSVVKRLQIMDVYRDIDLSTPMPRTDDAAQEALKSTQGITDAGFDPEDRDYEIYEIYCELDIPGFEHKHKGKPSGLEVPYRVTLDVGSRQILSIVRNYKEETKDLPVALKTFVTYTFVPGLGFYPIGLLNILGNTTNAVTAAWRELLDAGMYSNFPGFLMADTGARQQTNILRVPPGGAAVVKTNGVPIKEAVMPLPYQPPSTALMQLVEDMASTGQRIGGTSELEVGEGRADVPVGTTMALIEQATKVLNSVHKRLHISQAEEFELLMEVFKDHPEAFWQRQGPSKIQWDETTFLEALQNCNLVPRADPNTASSSQRLMKVMALKQLEQQSPNLYDPMAIDTAAIKAIGFADPKQFFLPPAAQAKPPPELIEQQAKQKVDQQKADATTLASQARMLDAQTKKAEVAAKGGLGDAAPPPPPPPETESDKAAAQAKLLDAQTKAKGLDLKAAETRINDQNRDQDRQSTERVALLELAKSVINHHQDAAGAHQTAMAGHAVDLAKTRESHEHEADMAGDQQDHDKEMAKMQATSAEKQAKAAAKAKPATPKAKPK